MKRALIGGSAVAVVLVGGAVMVAVALMTMLVTGKAPAATTAVTTCTVRASGGDSAVDMEPQQVRSAKLIISIGKSLKVPPRGWVIAISAAMQESNLVNVAYGDRDSLGLMQQRPSQGWGSQDQVTTPTYAVRAFYGGKQSPTDNSGLLDIPGWQNMSVWGAAQSVQRSAFPLAYAQHESTASALVEQYAHTTAGCDNLAAGPWTVPMTAGTS